MWGKIMIPMYRLWLHGLYELYGPRCPLSPERPLNLITHSLTCKSHISIVKGPWKIWINGSNGSTENYFITKRKSTACISCGMYWTRQVATVSLNVESFHDANFAVTSGTGGCEDNVHCSATSNSKVGITTTTSFQWLWHTVAPFASLLFSFPKPLTQNPKADVSFLKWGYFPQ